MTQEEVGLLDPAIAEGPFRHYAVRYGPGKRLKFSYVSAKSSVGELEESDARKAFRVHFWEAPAAGYAKRGRGEGRFACRKGRARIRGRNDR